MHGDQVPKGKYPWAVALVTSTGLSYCGGTLISPRHFITARHCVDDIHGFAPIFVKVGGVCHSVKPEDGCPRSDMQTVEVEFGAYEPRQTSESAEAKDDNLRIKSMGHDMAIFQLKEDLTHHFEANVID
ncbi:trypsin domain-containing protein [Ditylenchus destructor]|nr:trypsin domain-containing protein [Ditylenchus destructor]